MNRLAYEIGENDVTVVMRARIGAPASLRIPLGEAKRFAWALLNDIDSDAIRDTALDYAQTVGRISVDDQDVWVDGKRIHVPKVDRRILNLLVAGNGTCVSNERLVLCLQGYGEDQSGPYDCVKVHVFRLRRALGSAGDQIETVRGEGYRLLSAPSQLNRPGQINLKRMVLDRLAEGPATFKELRAIRPDGNPDSLQAALSVHRKSGAIVNIGTTRHAIYKLKEPKCSA